MNKTLRTRMLRSAALVVLMTPMTPMTLAQTRRPAPAAAVSPESAPIPQVLFEATTALRAGDPAKATALFEVVRNRPGFASARPPLALFLAAGDQHFGQGTAEELETALQIYAQAIEVFGGNLSSPELGLLWLRRAQVMMRQSRTEQAREELATLRKRVPSRRAAVYADLGDAELLLLASQPEAARDKLAGLIEVEDPVAAAMALFGLGRAHAQLKETDQAVTAFRRLWNRHGDSDLVKQAIFLVGQIYFDRGDFLEARKLYEACSVIGAAMQTRVRPGDELIVKVRDPNHFGRTRSTILNCTLTVPSGDTETVRLDKNPVSEQLYIGRIRTTLAMPAANDGLLQVGGGDVIDLSYGDPPRSQKVQVVDDGAIQIDSVIIPEPPPRHEATLAKGADAPKPKDQRPAIAASRQSSGTLNPGSPAYIQVLDADLDTSARPDTFIVEVVAQGSGKETVVKAQLTETGPRTGVFTGAVSTALASADSAPAQDVLPFGVTQVVFARYTDTLNETPGTSIVRQSRKLGARYHNASLALVKPSDDNKSFRPAWRLDLDASPHLLLNDADLDTTPEPDSAQVQVFTESGDSQALQLTETGPGTGAFLSALSLSTNPEALANPRLLHIREGDFVWATCIDERNMQPGEKTTRALGILENRPTAGEWGALPLIATAWPFEIKAADDTQQAPITPRPAGKGRVTLAIHDPDTLANAATGIAIRVNTLLGNAGQELVLPCTGPGAASQQLDLVLGDLMPSRLEGVKPGSSSAELSVPGDDLVRLAYSDARIPTADIQTRGVVPPVASPAGAPRPKPPAPAVTPVIRLTDPSRRVAAAQDLRLAAFKAQLNARLAAYTAERALLEEYRLAQNARLAAMPKTPTTAPADGTPDATEALKGVIADASRQIDVLAGRIDRLKSLGAAAAPPTPAPATQPAAAPDPADALLVPGHPFELVIDDPDLTAPAIPVRIRSTAGRLVQKFIVQASRQATGQYRVTIPTRAEEDPAQEGALLLVPGGEVIVDYADDVQAVPKPQERVAYLALASDAALSATDSSYADEVTKIRLGEPLFVQVIDFDADRSGGIDQLPIVARTSLGDRAVLMLSETEPHSGVFRGRVLTDNAPANTADDRLQAGYGGSIELAYQDHLRESADQPADRVLRLAVAGGTDGAVEGFSRQFRDAQEEMKLWFSMGQAAYQIGRRLYLAGAAERAEEYLTEASDYFAQLATRFPDHALAASADYHLGNIQSLKGNHTEALARFRDVVARWPKSDFVAKARYKIGQELEGLGYFDQAAEAYVLLTYHHPNDAHVPLAMIRMMNYYARGEQFPDAVSIAQKFVEKFPKHEHAGGVALKAGQWLAVSGKSAEALAWFMQAEKQFASSDTDMPSLLYWHAATLLQLQQETRRPRGASDAQKIRELLQRVIYDYPKSEYANLARAAMELAPEAR